MDAFGFMAWIVLMWAWYCPERLGRWIAKVKVGITAAEREVDR